ncbi:MAG: ATP-binding cassette domain-containing protein [Thermodesulfobacteriota bacterium]
MALVSLQEISLAFSGKILFNKISVQLEAGERIALIGRNGVGKTTLMKVISESTGVDSGKVVLQRNTKVAHLSQEIPKDISGKIFDIVLSGLGEQSKLLSDYYKINKKLGKEQTPALLSQLDNIQTQLNRTDGWKLDNTVKQVLTNMELDPENDFATLSGGQKRRVLLAKAIVSNPDVLMLDEPTNHLDINSINWLEEFLLVFKGCLFFVTHDRTFLERLATRIIELDRGELFSSQCNYKTFLERKQMELDSEEKERALFDKKLAEEEVWIRKGVRARRTRNEGRVRELIKMREEKRRQLNRIGKAKINIEESEKSGRLVIKAENIGHKYDGDYLFKDFTTRIMRGDKIGVIGPNGSGKTTLLNVLLGKLIPNEGEVELGTNLDITYYDQLREKLDEEKTMMENVSGGNDIVMINGKSRHIVGYLQDFLFSPNRVRSKVSVLSGGERNRLLLARLFTKPSNLLVMDEPTNDLDIETLELLEELLSEYSGTVLLVSHDRSFLNNIVTSTIALEGDGKINEYLGGYDDWLKQRVVEETKIAKEKPKTEEKPKNKKEDLSFKEKKELEELPLQIHSLEEEQKDLHAVLSNPEVYKNEPDKVDQSKKRLDEIEDEISVAFERWTYLDELKASF